ncbi:MAG TPA: GNAT family N-acetyltransferase [Candidatus Dormibacteraeota bacterium]
MLTVTPAAESDLPALVELFEEMDRFYGVTAFEPAETRQAQIQSVLFRDPPAAHMLLARDADRVVGLASYSFLWPAVGLTQSLFLKELYVAEAYRKRGIGRLLMERVFALATEKGCSRVEWMTEQANADAQAFYAKLGHEPSTEKVFYRVQAPQPPITMKPD